MLRVVRVMSLRGKVGVELDHRDLTRAYPDPETALAVNSTGLVASSDELIRWAGEPWPGSGRIDFGLWNAGLLAARAYVLVIALVMALLPSVDETP